ncbi:MAG: methyltransferase regulatory domain-containing protein [Bdellovibrio bacteriovorus]
MTGPVAGPTPDPAPAPTLASYDAIPYESFALPETHPDHLGAIGALLGIDAAPVDGCRVLELGSAAGGNLIPMAFQLPGSDFVGVELSAQQAGRGQALIGELGLGNCRLLHQDILGLNPDPAGGLGSFDYILVHGVYSWVPEPVREHILRLCGGLLAAHGIAYVSYNVAPGWRSRGMLRDMLLHHCREAHSPAERLAKARQLLDLLAAGLAGDGRPEAEVLRRELEYLQGARASYLYHEYLEEVNAPETFSDFMARARGHGLRYLADARLHTLFPTSLNPAAQSVLDRFETQSEMEQYMDFFTLRPFRRSLLVRVGAEPNLDIDLGRLLGFSLYGDLEPAETAVMDRALPQSYRTAGGGAFHLEHPLTKALVERLAAVYPNARPLPDLLEESRRLVGRCGGEARSQETRACLSEVFSLYCSGGLGLSRRAAAWPARVSARPCATPLARAQAAAGEGHAATARHRVLALDPLSAHLLGLLDGTRDRASLIRGLMGQLRGQPDLAPDLMARCQDPGELETAVAENLERLLCLFARNGLLQS